jgi:hypothetical protein
MVTLNYASLWFMKDKSKISLSIDSITSKFSLQTFGSSTSYRPFYSIIDFFPKVKSFYYLACILIDYYFFNYLLLFIILAMFLILF